MRLALFGFSEVATRISASDFLEKMDLPLKNQQTIEILKKPIRTVGSK